MPGVRESGYGACSRPGPYLQRPAEVALFLACAQNVAARILNLLDLSSSAPLERYTCSPFVPLQQGGGLFVSGTATLINSAIYQNEATVGAHSEPTS